MNKSQFTNELMSSLDKAQKQALPAGLSERMERYALSIVDRQIRFSRSTLFGIAASFLLLLSANVIILSDTTNKDKTENNMMVDYSYDLMPTKSIYHE